MKTILVIDDSETILGLVSEALRGEGHHVHATSDVFAANRHIYRGDVDLILLDIQMPAVQGNEVCRILKSKPETKGIPILFFSDLPDEELARLVAEAGADGYLSKSLELPRIVSAVRQRLGPSGD